MDIIAHCRAAVKEPGSAFFIKRRAVFCQEPPRRSGPRERAGFHGIPSLRWNKWQSSYKSNDTSFNIDCLPTWQSSPDWQTTYFASWAQVCHLGKVRFTALVRGYFGTWPDNLRGSGVATERACRCWRASASKKIPQQNARKTRIFLEICLRRLQTGPKCGKMIHGYLMTTT